VKTSRASVREVCGPLLTEVGDRWSEGKLSVAEEHLVSGALRNLLDSLGRLHAPDKAPVALLAAPSGERHEFGSRYRSSSTRGGIVFNPIRSAMRMSA